MTCIQRPETAGQHPVFTYVRSLYQCRELGAALARYTAAATLANVRRSIGAGLPSSSSGGSIVTGGAALVATLVLKELDAPEHPFTCKPSQEGLEVLRLLQHAVFGEAGAQGSLAQCAYLASLAQAAHALELVTAALLDAVSPSNCLSLLNVAAACGCAPLRRAAGALALRDFPAASAQDANGLMAMEERHLLALLCSDALTVVSELDAFRALAAWTEARREERSPRFAARLARCVRLHRLTLAELYLLDAHPLVASDRQAVQLVAQVYLHATAGVPLDSPLGLHTTMQLRDCQRGCAAARQPAPTAACRLAEHAGQHESVFEAAACALARQRPVHCGQEDGGAACSAAGAAPAAAQGAPQARCLPPCGSPAVTRAQAPTPTDGETGVPGGACRAPQQRSRVRHHGAVTRVSSRRTLFDAAAGGAGWGEGWRAKSVTPEAPPPAMPAATAAGGPGGDCSGQLVGSVALEMGMSPRHASLQGISQQAATAAAEPQPANWASRKRLRFE